MPWWLRLKGSPRLRHSWFTSARECWPVSCHGRLLCRFQARSLRGSLRVQGSIPAAVSAAFQVPKCRRTVARFGLLGGRVAAFQSRTRGRRPCISANVRRASRMRWRTASRRAAARAEGLPRWL